MAQGGIQAKPNALRVDESSLGKQLRLARVRLGLTQAELGKRVGLAANHIGRIESGEKAEPRFFTVARIAYELGVSLDDLAAALGVQGYRRLQNADVSLIRQTVETMSSVSTALEAAKERLESAITTLSEPPKERRPRKRNDGRRK